MGYLNQDYWKTNIFKSHYHKMVIFPEKNSIGLWKHTTRPISFTLVVDYFRVKYVGKENEENLLNSLKIHYEKVTVYWKG